VRAVLVGVAGAAGALCRYGIGLSVGSLRFPWATLGINVAGSFVLGLLLEVADARGWSPDVSVPLAVGFLGAFTTFSTFSGETHLLLRTDRTGTALIYVLVSVGLGIAAAAGGYRLGTTLR
jgi:fluoride exporter